MANEAAVMENKRRSGRGQAGDPQPPHATGQPGSYPDLLAETDNSTFRIHCYGPKSGENGLHAHIDEDHIFVVLEGEAQFYDLDGALPVLKKHQALMLPKGCFYSFSNDGDGAAGHAALRRHGEELDGRPARSEGQANPRPRQGARFQAAEVMIETHISNSHGRSASLSTTSAAHAATWRGRSAARAGTAHPGRRRHGGSRARAQSSATSSPGSARSFSHSTASSFEPMRPVMKL